MVLELTKEIIYTENSPLRRLCEALFDAAILVDEKGKILWQSQGSLDLDREQYPDGAVGADIQSVNPYTKVPMVIRSGKARMNSIEVIHGRKCLANSIPIKEGNVTIGALSTVLFRNINTLKTIIASIEKNASESDSYNILSRISTNYTFEDYIGESASVHRMIEQCRRAALTNKSILLIGETGTGKEILASGIHSYAQGNTWMPFIKINCSAIPPDLLESELFGHEKGAFTGATALQKGKFEMASGGSILLDEIGEMPLAMQSKLLRVLEEREFERVGGSKMIPLKARIIASTNKNLKKLSQEGKFRADLYYRLSSFEIHVPPLRQRKEDIGLIKDSLIKRDELHFTLKPEAEQALLDYHWPGNVRELRNILNRLDTLCMDDEMVSKQEVMSVLYDDFIEELSGGEDDFFRENAQAASDLPHNRQKKEEPCLISRPATNREAIIQQLQLCNGNISAAAKKLGICRATMYKRMKEYRITVE